MFGIIAGVLVSIWAMYTMLGDESDTKMIVTEIQLIRAAVQEYRTAGGALADLPGNFESLQPYVGAGFDDSLNGLGYPITLRDGFPSPSGNPNDDNMSVALVYYGVTDYALCVKVLQHFGEIHGNPTANKRTGTVQLEAGKTISGYVGSADPQISGCVYNKKSRSHRIKVHMY